jgi:hypothetical protein
MILFLVLTLNGCETTRETQQIKIPDFSIVKPTRPELVEIPADTSAALKAMAINMSKMDAYILQLEIFLEFQVANFENISKSMLR